MKTHTRLLMGLLAWASSGCSDDESRPGLLHSTVDTSGRAPSGTSTQLEDSTDGRLVGGPCPADVPAGHTAHCGTLTVPQDRTNPGGPELELAVAVLEGKREGATPVVYLEGGPGGPAIDSVFSQVSIFEPLLENRDLVIVDQRGTGYSVPKLECTELLGVAPSDEQAALEALSACRQRLVQAGSDLQSFTTRENAADVDDLRASLGYSAWHLLGISYGTRLALDVMRYHPGGVAAAVIDSVLPTDADFIASAAENAARSFDQLFSGCSAQSDCAEAYPNLEAVFYDLVERSDATPIELPTSGLSLTGTDILMIMFQLSYSAEVLSVMPELITQIDEGKLEIIDDLAVAVAESSAGFADAMYLSIVCSEYVAFVTQADVDKNNEGVHPAVARALGDAQELDFCAEWSVAAAPSAERDPARSDVPTLVLAGQFDPVTPPAWAARAAATLSNSTLLEFAAQSHGAFLDDCGADLLNAFFEAPGADPSNECPWRDRPLQFFVAPARQARGAAAQQTGLLPWIAGAPPEVKERLRFLLR